MTDPALPRHKFPCPQTDGLHAWLRIHDHPTSKHTWLCTSCCLLVHTLKDGRGMIVEPSYLSGAKGL